MPASQVRVREIFLHAVSEVPEDQRTDYVVSACAGDTELIDRVQALLRHHADNESFLQRPAAELDGLTPLLAGAADLSSLVIKEKPFTRVGPYELLEVLGEGGMGTVWLAEQAAPVKRRVALKLIKAGMDSTSVLARFESECQVLALMDHPHIAKVLDAGATENGRPYFAMELVKGVTITRYCDEQRLTPRDRLQLFVSVCQAVQHAHQKGIIHRDLKPSNVLVTRYDGQAAVKVIDFGIAKVLQAQTLDRSTLTGMGTLVGTPEYMSPEQADLGNRDIDTRSDVYSLGVMLYELLIGTTPMDQQHVRKAGLLEALRIIREEVPPRPSTRLSHSETLLEIAAKRGLQPRSLTSVIRGELEWLVMKCLEKDRTRRYDSASSLARDIERYLNQEAVHACPPSLRYRASKFVTRNKRVLATATVLGLLFAITFAAVAGSAGWILRDREGRRETTHKEVSEALTESRRLLRERKFRAAGAWLQRAQGSIAAGESWPELDERVQELDQELKMAQRLLDRYLQRAEVKDGDFDYVSADAAYAREFRDFGIDVENLSPEAAGARIGESNIAFELSLALDDWALVRRRASKDKTRAWAHLSATARIADPDPWRNKFRQAVDTRGAAGEELLLTLAKTEARDEMPAPTQVLIGRTLREARFASEAVTFLRKTQRRYPEDFWANFELGWALTLISSPRWDEAIGYYRAALAIQPETVVVHNLLAIALLQQGDRYAEALDSVNESIRRHPTYAPLHNQRGVIWRKNGNLVKAVDSFEESLRLRPDYPQATYNLGMALFESQKLDLAAKHLQRAAQLDPNFVEAHFSYGLVMHDLERPDEAIIAFREAIRLDPHTAYFHNDLGKTLVEMKRFDEAIGPLKEAMRLDAKKASTHFHLGRALAEKKKYPEACVCFEEFVRLEPKSFPGYRHWADTCANAAEFDKAILLFREALKVKENDWQTHLHLGRALLANRQHDQALISLERASQLEPKSALPHVQIGMTLERQDDWESAAVAFAKAISLDPKNASAHHQMGIYHVRKKDLGAAARSFETAATLNPIEPETHYNLATVYVQQKILKKGITHYETTIRLKPDYAKAHYNLGIVHIFEGRYEEAIGCFRNAYQINKDYELARVSLARALNESAWKIVRPQTVSAKEAKHAIELASEAVAVQPTNASAWNTLGVAHYRAGAWKEATANLQKGVNLSKRATAHDFFFLAMAHWQEGNQEEARVCYDRAITWMKENSVDDQCRQFHDEATALLKKVKKTP